MKMLLAALAVIAALATPALAQSYDPDYGGGNITPLPTYQYAPHNYGYGAYAQSYHGYAHHYRYRHGHAGWHRGW